MEDKSNIIFNITTVIIGFLTYMFGYAGQILILIPLSLIIDYILGIVALIYKGGVFSKEIGIWGLIRKLCYFIIIIGAFIIDYIIRWLALNAGINLPINNICMIATTVYLIGTEWISILKHCHTLKVPTPKFLIKAFIQVKGESENIMNKGGNKSGDK